MAKSYQICSIEGQGCIRTLSSVEAETPDYALVAAGYTPDQRDHENPYTARSGSLPRVDGHLFYPHIAAIYQPW